MVDLFNRIDDAARSDLRLFNEQNALRFEARLDQRTAELSAEIEKLDARLTAELRGEIGSLRADFGKLAAEQRAWLEKTMHAQTRSMIAMWAIVVASHVALWLR